MIGFLRKGVKVIIDIDSLKIQGPLLEVSLPRGWADNYPELWALLDRRIAKQKIVSPDNELQAVLTLLETQGYFSTFEDKAIYSLREVKALLESVSLQWYARYYSHPLWQSLRDGSLSRNSFVAWLIHNYHISRAAGITSARFTTRAPRLDLRKAFQSDVLEEY